MLQWQQEEAAQGEEGSVSWEVELGGRAEAAERREIIPVYENPSHKADNRSRCGFIWQQEQQQQQKEENILK